MKCVLPKRIIQRNDTDGTVLNGKNRDDCTFKFRRLIQLSDGHQIGVNVGKNDALFFLECTPAKTFSRPQTEHANGLHVVSDGGFDFQKSGLLVIQENRSFFRRRDHLHGRFDDQLQPLLQRQVAHESRRHFVNCL